MQKETNIANNVKAMIQQYIALNSKVENLCYSTRLEAISQAAQASVDASVLHSKITETLEEMFFYYTRTNNYETNRSIVSKLLGTIIVVKDTLCIQYVSDTFFFSFSNNIFKIELFCNLQDNSFILDYDLEKIEETLCYSDLQGAFGAHKIEMPKEPATTFASESLIKLAKQLNKEVVYKLQGSMHEKWLVVTLN